MSKDFLWPSMMTVTAASVFRNLRFRRRCSDLAARRTETFGMHRVRCHSQPNQCLGNCLDHRIRTTHVGFVRAVAAAETLVELRDFVGIDASGVDGKFLLFLAENEMQLQPIRVAIFQRDKILDEHRRILPAIAIEQRESTARLIVQDRCRDRQYRRNAAAGGETQVILAVARRSMLTWNRRSAASPRVHHRHQLVGCNSENCPPVARVRRFRPANAPARSRCCKCDAIVCHQRRSESADAGRAEIEFAAAELFGTSSAMRTESRVSCCFAATLSG